jgi:hypothetical protein
MSKSTLTAIADVWNLMSEYVLPEDKAQLADNLVIILMDNDYSLDDIRQEFDGDAEVLDAIKFYVEDTSEEIDDDDSYHIDYESDYDE